MKKIKRFYQEHRIFTILMAVVLVCMVLIITVLIQCFYVGNGSDKYGNRLEGIEKYKISESRQKDFENNIANNDKVKSVDIKVTGKIIYITMQITEGVELVEAQSIAQKSLESFSEKEQSFYDFNITLKQNSTDKSDGFIISGAKNKNGSGLTWNNNRIVEKDITTEEK
jgi:hypothetical protein